MTSSTGRDVESPPAGSPATFDWRAIEASPAFRELVQRKRRFIVPAAIVSGAIFGTYLLLAAFASGFMGTRVAGLPVGWLLAVGQVVMTWVVTWLYLRKADREWEPWVRQAADEAAAALDRDNARFAKRQT